jgi:Fe-S cluster assembly protein SufD
MGAAMTENPVIVKRSTHSQAEVEKKLGFSPVFSSYPERSIPFREKAWETFKALPFPTKKDDAWHRTDISRLPLDEFGFGSIQSDVQIPAAFLVPVADKAHGGQVILKNDSASVHVDEELKAKGVIFTDLNTAWLEHPDLMEKIAGSLIDPKEDKFAALSFAVARSGVLLYIPKAVRIENPLHSLTWSSGQGAAYFTNIYIVLDEDAEVTYVHESASPNADLPESLHAGVMEIVVKARAKLRFVELQSWGENVWNFTHERVRVEREGNIEWIFGALGSKLTKNFSDLELTGQGSTGKVSGFYFTHGKQHLDHDTQQNHLAPNTTSDLLYKGALVGESRSVWQGMIYVAKEAVKTDGYQANRNLILDGRARADSIPGLEILTDDVRCSHGATVGKIDPDELFYLESRGLPKSDAERLVVEGFFDPIMQRIPFEGVRSRFQQAILEKMQGH